MAEIFGEALEMDLGQSAVVIEHVDTVNNAGTVTHADEVVYITPDAPEIVVPTEDIEANTAARHTHGNKALLDTYTQPEANLADAVSKKHSHSNKADLDEVTTDKLLPEVTADDNGKHLVVVEGAWVHTRKLYPTLSATQKTAIKNLMDSYYSARSRFKYDYSHGRGAFSSVDKCWITASSKYKLNCNTFAQMIMMGRAVTDFKTEIDAQTGKPGYTAAINTAFDFGYYAGFDMRTRAGGLAKTQTPAAGTAAKDIYYGFVQPNKDVSASDYTESYSRNSYYTGSDHPYGQTFNSFVNANDLAFELYWKGCEIPFSELQVGDLVFQTEAAYTDDESDFYHKNAFWRGIGHVAVVYNITQTGRPTFMECVDDSNTIIKSGTGMSGADEKTRGAHLMKTTVFCARLPIAWGIESNVPSAIEAFSDYTYPAFQGVT